MNVINYLLTLKCSPLVSVFKYLFRVSNIPLLYEFLIQNHLFTKLKICFFAIKEDFAFVHSVPIERPFSSSISLNCVVSTVTPNQYVRRPKTKAKYSARSDVTRIVWRHFKFKVNVSIPLMPCWIRLVHAPNTRVSFIGHARYMCYMYVMLSLVTDFILGH